MKQSPQDKQLYENFQPGKITKEGFLGNDRRQIHDIIEADERILSQLGVSREQIADRLQYFIEEGKKGIETPVELEGFITTVIWRRGMLPSPFGDPKRLYHKLVATVVNTSQQKELTYTQLNVHMIRDHGFFEGKGSLYRLEPEEVVELLELGPEKQQ
ncbi:hypothetical protein CSB45_08275 [candidate division KSB3 bacterium]|uniref:Uncharacterized protein n=1 Tax=candidate division KSB3 bacterium TaxID=2044937 RepID=A0A2G6E570_9BACT|nr:MAG: hypothetical protein CSB45_08275 [candidate division KSB3 bacterium]PIE29784.1 MAG: hypothetical protein CSA57_06940 [candidate division KSB3 bacterium]